MRRKQARSLARKLAVVFCALVFLLNNALVSAASLYSIDGALDFWGGFFPSDEGRSVVKADEKNPVSEVAKQANAFISPLDQETGEIVNEECDIVKNGIENTMRCSKTPRFREIDGQWQTFSDASAEAFSANQLRFTVAGKNFALRPYIIQKGKKKYVDELSRGQAKKLNYRVDFDSQNRYTKWTSYFQNDGTISESGYTLVTDMSSRFVESRPRDKLEALNLILDDSIQVSFDDLVASGYTIDRRDNNIAITGFGIGEVSLDPSLFFYSTASVDGHINYCDGTPEYWYIDTTGTTNRFGENHYETCMGGSFNDTRLYLSFDTSALNDSITISSATLSLYADSYTYWKYQPSTWDTDYYMNTNQIGATLDSGDWGFSTNDGQMNWSGTTGWKNYTIASPTSVSKTGDTDFELRYAWTPNGSDRYAWANARMTDYTGVNSDPYLTVTWNDYWGNQFITSTTSSMGSMTNSGYRSATSFTAKYGQKVLNIRLYLQTVTSSPTYRFGLQSDSGGNPSGTWLSGIGGSSYVDVAPTATGWNTFTFSTSPNTQPTLTAGTVYHIVVQYVSGTIGASNYIAVRRETPLNLMTPYRNESDTMQDTEWYNGSSWSDQGYQPIYFIDGTNDEGNPNNNGINWGVYNNYSRAEKITVYGPSKKADKIGFYIQKLGASCGSPSADLTYDIRDSSDTQLATGTVVTSGTVTSSLVWYDVTLSSTVDLKTGQTYRIQLDSTTTTACYYSTQSNYSYVAGASEYYALSYNGTASRGGYCTTSCTSDANWTYYDYYDIDFRFNVKNIFTPYSQNWRMYGDEDTATPVYPYAAENTAPPDKIGKKEPIKLRMTVAEIGGMGEDNIRFKVQYSTSSVFATAIDVSTIASCTFSTWCYYDGGNATDDSTIASRVLSDSDTSGTYNETNTASTFDLTASTETEFEYTITGYGASANTTYYFRLYDTVNSQAVTINPTGGYSYPNLTTSSSFSLSDSAPASVEFIDYAIGTASDSIFSMSESDGKEINVWDDRGTGVGWSAVAKLQHLREITEGTVYSGLSASGLGSVHVRKVVATADGIVVTAYNDGTNVRFKKSSDKTDTWSEAITGSPTGAGGSSSQPAIFMDASENIHLCYGNSNNIYYRLLTKSGTQWAIGSEKTVVAAGGGINYTECSIVAESDGDLMVAVKGADAANGVAVRRSTSGGDTWADSWSWATTNDDPSLGLMSSTDKTVLMYINSSTGLMWDLFNGSTWDGAAQVESSLPTNKYSFTIDSSSAIHLAYVESDVLKYRKYTSSWSGETTIYDGTSIGANVVVPSITTDNTSLWVFYSVYNSDIEYYYLDYREYDGSAWDGVNTILVSGGDYYYYPHAPANIKRNQFYCVYGIQTGGSAYAGYSWYNHDLIRAGDVTIDPTEGAIALYGAEIGSCPSAGVCGGSSNTLDPESSVTVVDADACTGSGCPDNAGFGMGKYYIEPGLSISNLNLRRIGSYSGTMTITVS